MRVLAFSDLHLDAPFAQGGPELASLRRADLRRTLERIVQLADQLGVDAVMCAGDLYEHERFTPDTVKLLERVFARLDPIPVLISPGNHDWHGPSSVYATAAWSPNVHVFDSPVLASWDGLEGVRVWGFAHLKPSGTGNPLEGFSTEGDAMHIGLLHGSEVSGWSWAAMEDPKKQQHAPFSADQIAPAGLSHCVVGHYHKRVEGAHHTYAGAPAALSFGESGDGGAVEITFDEAGGPPERVWHRVSSIDVHSNLELDVSGHGDIGAIETELHAQLAPLSGIARITLVGDLEPSVDLDIGLLHQRVGSLSYLSIRTELRSGYDFDKIAAEPTVRGEFVKAVQANDELDDDKRRRVLVTGLRALDGRNDLEVV